MLPEKRVSNADMVLTRPLTSVQQDAAEHVLAGYSPRIAWRMASGDTSRHGALKFQKSIEVQMYLAVRRMELRTKKGITEAEWLDQCSAIAYFDIIEIAENPPKKPEDLANLPKHVRMCIQGYKWDKHNNFVVEFVSKKAAIDMLGKFMGVYQKDRQNDKDVPGDLLKTAFWKYVMSMHLGTGVTVAEAIMDARNNPENVEKWARAEGLLSLPTAGEIVVE